MQERDVAGIDAAFQSLQPIAFLQPLRHEALLGRHQFGFPFWQGRLLLRWAHIGPQHAAALDQWIGFELNLVTEAAFDRFRRHLDALAGVVVFPAVMGAARTVLLVAAKPQRYPTVGAKLVD